MAGFSLICWGRQRSRLWLWALVLAGCAGLAGCARPGDKTISELLGEESNTGASGDDQSSARPVDDPTVGDVATGDVATGDATSADNDNSGDVNTGGGDDTPEPTTQPQPSRGTVSARVRNESAFRADVTMRFIHGETIVHLAFVRVLPATVTTVVSPEVPELIELSGVDERGQALTGETFAFGVDFDEVTPAEYNIPAVTSGKPLPQGPIDDDVEPAMLTMLKPAGDDTWTLGSMLLVGWVDGGGAPGAVVRVFLRPAGSTDATDLIGVGPAVGAALDGVNDELLIVLEDLDPGSYEVVGEIDDGRTVATSVAPGQVRVSRDPDNAPPSLEIVSPEEQEVTELHRGEALRVEWEDADTDDNATISFSLERAEPTGVAVGPFLIGPPIAEEPDGDLQDTAMLVISVDVLPGLYDLVGTIDDGQAVGTARVEGVVRVLEDPVNKPPELELLEPEGYIEIGQGESFRVQWKDSDENDNAQISLSLDPDPGSGTLCLDEVLLVASLDEDDDGADDEIILHVPQGTCQGAYRVKGEITDGVWTMVAWAPGIVRFAVATLPGREDDGTPPPPPPPPPAPELTLIEPSAPVWTRVGETIDVAFKTVNLPDGANVQLYLSNEEYADTVESPVTVDVDVTPPNLMDLIQNSQNEVTQFTLTLTGDIPNGAWPRQFELKAELEVDDPICPPTTAPGVVWIRQEVEVESVETFNYGCTQDVVWVTEGRHFIGIEIKWYGGGFQEREPHAEVQFWVVLKEGDGEVPDDSQEDETHRVFHKAQESPNVERMAYLDVGSIVRFPNPEGLDEMIEPEPESGEYQVILVVEPEGFGRITSGPHPDPVDICFPLPDLSSAE